MEIASHRLLIVFLYSLLLFPLKVQAQGSDLSISVSVYANTYCNETDLNGQDVARNILINEVCFAPDTADGDLIHGGEWVEFFNCDSIYSVDISGYIFSNTQNLGNADGGGSILFPQGIVIPPHGFCILRGERACPIDSFLLVENGGNCVEVVVNDSLVCYSGRFFISDEEAAIILYDTSGIVQDIVGLKTYTYNFTVQQSCHHPCIPERHPHLSQNSDTLPSFCDTDSSLISEVRTHYVRPRFYRGKTVARLWDGGPWGIDTFFTPTYGYCNSETTLSDTIIYNELCTGYAVLTPAGGVPPYMFYSNGGYIQGDTILHLCGGIYTIMLIDNRPDTIVETFYVPYVEIHDTVVFEIPESELPFVWNNMVFNDTESGLLYLENSQGCDSLISYYISVFSEDTDSIVVMDTNGTIDTIHIPTVDSVENIETQQTPLNEHIFVPNAFTPNGDGQNDLFLPVFNHPERLESYRLHVYDRWGRLLFSTDTPHQGWKCDECPVGVYVWRMEYKASGESSKILTGNVTIVR